MIHYIQVTPQGEITNAGSSSGFKDTAHFLQAVPGAMFVEQPLTNPLDHYWDGLRVCHKGIAPSQHHTFDYLTKTWKGNTEQAWLAVKGQRSQLLLLSDWVVVKAQETAQSVPANWSVYRQALRDITEQADPWNIQWPISP